MKKILFLAATSIALLSFASTPAKNQKTSVNGYDVAGVYSDTVPKKKDTTQWPKDTTRKLPPDSLSN